MDWVSFIGVTLAMLLPAASRLALAHTRADRPAGVDTATAPGGPATVAAFATSFRPIAAFKGASLLAAMRERGVKE